MLITMGCRVVLLCALLCAIFSSEVQSDSPRDIKQLFQNDNEMFEDSEEVPCKFLTKYNKVLKEIRNLKMKLNLANQKQCDGTKEKYKDIDSSINEETERIISGLKNSLLQANDELKECKVLHENDKATFKKDIKFLENLQAADKSKLASQENDLKNCNKIRETEKSKYDQSLKLTNQRLVDFEKKVNSQTSEIQACNKLRTTETTNCNSKINELTKTCKKPGSNLNMVKLSTGSYHFSKDMKMNWNSAKEFCSKNGLQLLSIENDAENKAVIDYIKKIGFPHDDKYFTSGTDQGQEGNWYWASTGKRFTYTAWLPPNPNKVKPPQHCATIWNHNQINWDNDYCHLNLKFICEMPK